MERAAKRIKISVIDIFPIEVKCLLCSYFTDLEDIINIGKVYGYRGFKYIKQKGKGKLDCQIIEKLIDLEETAIKIPCYSQKDFQIIASIKNLKTFKIKIKNTDLNIIDLFNHYDNIRNLEIHITDKNTNILIYQKEVLIVDSSEDISYLVFYLISRSSLRLISAYITGYPIHGILEAIDNQNFNDNLKIKLKRIPIKLLIPAISPLNIENTFILNLIKKGFRELSISLIFKSDNFCLEDLIMTRKNVRNLSLSLFQILQTNQILDVEILKIPILYGNCMSLEFLKTHLPKVQNLYFFVDDNKVSRFLNYMSTNFLNHNIIIYILPFKTNTYEALEREIRNEKLPENVRLEVIDIHADFDLMEIEKLGPFNFDLTIR